MLLPACQGGEKHRFMEVGVVSSSLESTGTVYTHSKEYEKAAFEWHNFIELRPNLR